MRNAELRRIESRDEAPEEEETKPGYQLDMGSEGEERGKEDPRFPFGGLDGWKSVDRG